MAANFLDCDIDAILAASKCIKPTCRSGYMTDALKIGVLIADLAASGGTDYTDDLTQLLTDARKWQVLNPKLREVVELYLLIQVALDHGATTPEDLDAFLQTVECYQCLGFETRKNLEVFLRCQLDSISRD